MRKKLTVSLEKQLQRYFPYTFYHLVQKPRYRRMFSAERQLARGARLSDNQHPSILFFTHPKCASRYVRSILVRLAAAEGMQAIDFDAYVTVDPPPLELDPYKPEGSLTKAFQPTGYCYGAIGSYRPIPDMDQYRVVLNLRDPRDVLTSLYYSTAYSHAVISPKLIRRRQMAKVLSVDEFVLTNAAEVLAVYSRYGNTLLKTNALFLKYEEMVADFERWLEKLVAHIGLTEYPNVVQAIIDEANFEVTKEDKYSQRRQVTPGDHRRKLKPETIHALNERFGDVLKALDYSA